MISRRADRIKTLLVTTIICLAASPEIRSADSESTAARTQEWANYIADGRALNLKQFVSNPLESLLRYGSDCKVNIVFNPAKSGQLSFRFTRGDDTIVSFEGHQKSVFGARKNILFFVAYPTGDSGGDVTAWDLSKGIRLWDTKLKALGGVGSHSGYSNEISLWITAPRDTNSGELIVAGHESNGSYLEVLDQETGRQLAHKKFERTDIPKRENIRAE